MMILFVILTLYGDDMFLVENSLRMISTVKGLLAKLFEMKDLGLKLHLEHVDKKVA